AHMRSPGALITGGAAGHLIDADARWRAIRGAAHRRRRGAGGVVVTDFGVAALALRRAIGARIVEADAADLPVAVLGAVAAERRLAALAGGAAVDLRLRDERRAADLARRAGRGDPAEPATELARRTIVGR